MPPTSDLRSQIASLAKKKAGLEKDRARHLQSAGTAAKAASDKMRQAEKTTSASLKRSYFSSATTHSKKHAFEVNKVADLSARIADIDKQLAAKSKAFVSAVDAEQKRDERLRKAEDTRASNRRRVEKSHALEMARLSPEVRHVIIQAPKPEVLRVLYMTSSPDLLNPLRVDAEVSSVQRAIMSAKHRHLIEVKYLPAASPRDFVDRINFDRPHVVHFSGHGDAGALLFDNASVTDPAAVAMTFDVLAQFLLATDNPPRLLVMNSCKSLDGAELLLEAVPILIGVADTINDASAAIFATQFYSAIANAQPVGHAFMQAKTAIQHALMCREEDLPRLVHREDIDPDAVRLIIEQTYEAS